VKHILLIPLLLVPFASAETVWRCNAGYDKEAEYGYAVLKINFLETKVKWFIFGSEVEYKITKKDDYNFFWEISMSSHQFNKYTGALIVKTDWGINTRTDIPSGIKYTSWECEKVK